MGRGRKRLRAPQLELLVPGRIRPGADGCDAHIEHIRLATSRGFDATLRARSSSWGEVTLAPLTP